MGTQQSRSGHGREGSQQQSQQTERRPEQDRDLQRNKQADRSGQNQRSDRDGQQQGANAGGQNASASSGQQPGRQQGQQNVHGEGNYAASKQYNDATKAYAQSGRVDDAARAAAPKSDTDAREMNAAEAEGKRHAKGEDPALSRRASPSSGEASQTPRPGHEEQ